jgi:hypothetical protein
MSLAWVLLIVAIVVLAGAVWLRRKRSHSARYVDTPSWQQEHWQEEHDRGRAARQRALDGG